MENERFRATKLYRTVASLTADFGIEHSFRIGAGDVHANRFLLMLATSSIAGDTNRQVLDALRTLRMPAAQLEHAENILPAAEFIHFGFEGGNTTDVGDLYKVYFEVNRAPDPDSDPAGIAPTLAHVALKWNEHDASRVASAHYYAPRAINDQQILDRVTNFWTEQTTAFGNEIAAIIQLAVGNTDGSQLRYLQVAEAGNPRDSFAVTMYQAKVGLAQAWPHIVETARQLGVAPERLPALKPIASEVLGNLAAGIHRSGKPFVTVYYGAKTASN